MPPGHLRVAPHQHCLLIYHSILQCDFITDQAVVLMFLLIAVCYFYRNCWSTLVECLEDRSVNALQLPNQVPIRPSAAWDHHMQLLRIQYEFPVWNSQLEKLLSKSRLSQNWLPVHLKSTRTDTLWRLVKSLKIALYH